MSPSHSNILIPNNAHPNYIVSMLGINSRFDIGSVVHHSRGLVEQPLTGLCYLLEVPADTGQLFPILNVG